MKILFVTDLHGSRWKYNRLFEIEKNQPLFTLHGHIHESPRMTGKWLVQLGKTICIQPGQLEELNYVTIDLSTMKCELNYRDSFK